MPDNFPSFKKQKNKQSTLSQSPCPGFSWTILADVVYPLLLFCHVLVLFLLTRPQVGAPRPCVDQRRDVYTLSLSVLAFPLTNL